MKKWILILTLIGSSMIFAGYRTDMISRMKAKEQRIETNYSGQGLSGEVQTMDEIQNAWDYELNKIYKLLMSKLSTAQKAKLRNEEREWLKRRERKVNSEIKGTSGGISGRMAYFAIMTGWAEDRAIELARRYDNLK